MLPWAPWALQWALPWDLPCLNHPCGEDNLLSTCLLHHGIIHQELIQVEAITLLLEEVISQLDLQTVQDLTTILMTTMMMMIQVILVSQTCQARIHIQDNTQIIKCPSHQLDQVLILVTADAGPSVTSPLCQNYLHPLDPLTTLHPHHLDPNLLKSNAGRFAGLFATLFPHVAWEVRP